MGDKLKVAIAAGGTAGHINPALALAEELVSRGHEVHFYGQATRLEAVAQRLLVPYDASLARAAASLEALSPLKVLARGYAIARDEEGHVVSDASALQVGDQLSVLLGKGTAHTQVMSVESAS